MHNPASARGHIGAPAGVGLMTKGDKTVTNPWLPLDGPQEKFCASQNRYY